MNGIRIVVAFAIAGFVMPDAFAQNDTSLPEIAKDVVPTISTAAFADRSQLRGARISPNGERLASAASSKGVDYVLLYNATSGDPIGKFAIGEKNRLNWIRWAGNDRLLLSASAYDEYNRYWTRLFVADIKAGSVYPLSRKEATLDGDDVVWIAPDGASVLVSMQANPRHYPSVYRFDLEREGAQEQVQGSRLGVWNWYADSDGKVRIGTGWHRDHLRVFYRAAQGDDIDLTERIRADDLRKANDQLRYFEILGVQPGTDVGFVLDEDETGRVGLRRYDFQQSKIVDTVYQNPDWDVESALFSRDGQPIAVTYTDDSSRIVWLDNEMGKLQVKLESALEEDTVRVVSRSDNDTRMVVQAGGAADPGAIYIFTPAKGTLLPLGEVSKQVPFEHLSMPKAITYTARDGTKIRAFLTLPRGRIPKNLPLIINPHGGPYGIRDELAYSPEVQLLANRGYAVLQPNYRGSGGYGDAFFDLGIGQIGRSMQDDLDDAMDWAVEQGIADPKRVCLVGASYGGYAAVWGVTRNPERYRCAASWAGVMDWESMLRFDSIYLTRKASRRWRERLEGRTELNLSDVSPLQQVKRLTRPILLAHGADDGIVNVGQYHHMLAAAKKQGAPVSELLLEGEGHGFTEIANEQAWYDALVTFLEAHNPAHVDR